jgi:hypothetical protein
MFVPLDYHAANVANVIASLDDDVRWFGVIDWLRFAASIASVDVDSFKHDPGSYLCGAAFEYEDAQAELRKVFAERLTVFAFVWSGLEAAIDVVDPPGRPGERGKIRRTCRFLQDKFECHGLAQGLSDEVVRFQALARDCVGMHAVERRVDSVSDIGAEGLGLYLVYELRNQFAHGAIAFPQPDSENQATSPHRDLIECATRIVLMQLQMLLIATLSKVDEPVYCPWLPGIDEDEAPLDLVLLACHLTGGVSAFQPGLASQMEGAAAS